MKIIDINAREIFDARGNPTIECEIHLEDEKIVRGSVPSGTSKSAYEAQEMRDGGARFNGMGVERSVDIIHGIVKAEVLGKEPDMVSTDLWLIELDGTDKKSKLGANTMLAVSIAMCKAQAAMHAIEPFELIAHLCGLETVSIPVPMFNMMSGGAHSDSGPIIQEFMIVPMGLRSYKLCLEAAMAVFHNIKHILQVQEQRIAISDEGGFALQIHNERDVLDILMEAIKMTTNEQEGSFVIALDVAASQLYDIHSGKYSWNHKMITREELIQEYSNLAAKYPIYSIEDGLDQNDGEGWQALHKNIGESVHIVGDDIFATNTYRIVQGIQAGFADAAIIKPNQIGTVTEALQAVKLCKENDVNVIASHRSGETNDSFIADFAVGVSAHHIKAGGCSRGEHLAKYNRLLRIEDMLTMSLLDE